MSYQCRVRVLRYASQNDECLLVLALEIQGLSYTKLREGIAGVGFNRFARLLKSMIKSSDVTIHQGKLVSRLV